MELKIHSTGVIPTINLYTTTAYLNNTATEMLGLDKITKIQFATDNDLNMYLLISKQKGYTLSKNGKGMQMNPNSFVAYVKTQGLDIKGKYTLQPISHEGQTIYKLIKIN